jgi:NAD+ synthase (glutamine-hydrolysing)
VYLTVATVDIDLVRMSHSRTTFTPAVDDSTRAVVHAQVQLPFVPYIAAPPSRATAWPDPKFEKQEEFTRAVALGLFDYLRKSKSRGFVVSLSGGADSAAIVYLIAAMVELACQELGLAGTCARLGQPLTADPRALVRQLLVCVYQATANSGAVTLNAARTVAEAVGAEFLVFDVEPLVRGYVGTVEQAIGRALTWERDDIALQNIQARVRAPGVWMIANLRGALLLATSNRSEAAVGYATMDGDTCGGLSPIAGIDKAFLREWLSWVEATGPAGLAPLPALRAVNVQAADRRAAPGRAGPDRRGGPDAVPAARRHRARGDPRQAQPAGVHAACSPPEFPQYDRPQLLVWVKRFFRLWCRNQWKRERYAPSFHLDDQNLDPKTWCRFPILSGGFEHELPTPTAPA